MNTKDEKNDSGRLIERIQTETTKTIQTLNKIWEEIGISEDIRIQREQMVIKHVCDLYTDMILEVKENKAELLESINTLLLDLNVLKKDLNEVVSLQEYDHMPLYDAKILIKQQLDKYQHLYKARKAEVAELLTREKELCHALGKKLKLLPISPLPSAEDMNKFQAYLEELSDEKFRKEEIFLKTKATIIDIMNELHLKPRLDFERKVVSDDDSIFLVSEPNMEQLDKLHMSLEQQRDAMKTEAGELLENIKSLWDRLDEPAEIRSEFAGKYSGYDLDTVRALRSEIQRLEKKKKDNIKIFVDKVRRELIVLWDKCRYSAEQRSEFYAMESDCYTEDLLMLHELEIDKLKTFYENNKTIFELCLKREKLWEKMIDLEHRANQPDRYKNRGGQLLREEKERKSIASQLPKIEKELLALVNDYETNSGNPFRINGQHLNDIIARDWEEHKENKHIKLSARKQAREQTIFTPSKSHLTPSVSRLTPAVSATKRKYLTPALSSKRTRLFEEKVKTAPPKILINGSIIKRGSIERRRRLERNKLRSHSRKDTTLESLTSDYDGFEKELQVNSTCRSTLFQDNRPQKQTNCMATPLKSPRKALKNVGNTPQLMRTPSRSNMRPKSPGETPRLTTAPGNLPIII